MRLYISDMARRWCTLEGGFLSYYESDRNPLAIGRVDVTEVVSLAVSNTETMTGAGYEHTHNHTCIHILPILLSGEKPHITKTSTSEVNSENLSF